MISIDTVKALNAVFYYSQFCFEGWKNANEELAAVSLAQASQYLDVYVN
jgi:hypothetical protein